MSKDSVLPFLQNPAFNRKDRFDYKAFCQEVFQTSAELAKLAMEKAAKSEETLALNSKTYKVMFIINVNEFKSSFIFYI